MIFLDGYGMPGTYYRAVRVAGSMCPALMDIKHKDPNVTELARAVGAFTCRKAALLRAARRMQPGQSTMIKTV